MLSENEAKILFFLKDLKKTNSVELAIKMGIPESSVLSLIELLREKGYVKTEVKSEKHYVLTEEGRKRKESGLPEDILINTLNGQEKDLNEIKNILNKDFNIAISWAKRKGLIDIKEGKVIPKVKTYMSSEYLALSNLERADSNTINLLKKRGLIEEKERKIVSVELIKEPKESEIGISNLNRELIISGEWKKYKLKKYNVEAFPPYYTISKKHYFREFLEKVKDIMISLGFKEINTGYIEMEFYNFDLLFQPQDHPAREIHDSFSVEGSGKIEDKDLLNNVKEIHEKFWKYEWKQDITLRLMLRSQTTATTARVLASRPKAPQKVFTLGKVFRPDAIDATHLIEFHQLDGVIIDNNFTFKELLGVLKEIFYRLGIKEVKFKPAYFPFTEPSVEAYGYLEKLGWVEMCGAGLLRPEILSSVGIDSTAGAWGIGIERLAMSFLNISDIRLLYSNNIEYIRDTKVKIE
ncbi:phenylalanine--tRNA ligase subunit alpha [Saccharolobus solfataricus]|nr:phenylalanine--tRNA ligase subunit alpha [Saccharolobus solfataricus]AKA75042.1 phenylalanine--tRNA ligase subunit alpha [Saccharolobus solfataricus]AKA77736.1 phenylalanine--tRNA ligase subunit alpha [Saccharolobus solfataricus]AKA80429.1 phenylalanine--tRNA ligase subunit alpha [Saccharolobus solfataricus]AZF69493.1 phenylalanine--tRNA ligase subunit alpha [Saccharolobus solfataricus]AZF72113.1 phenylalanine--tRNA ligase subunit alpha [Saccharolobus solfataricus]